MRKFLIIFIIGLMSIILVACEKTSPSTTETTTYMTTQNDTTINDTTTSTTTGTTNTTTETTILTTEATTTTTEETTTEIPYLSQAEVDSFSTQNVTLDFSYYMNSMQTEELALMIAAFEEQYPNVDIVTERLTSDRLVIGELVQDILGGSGADVILVNQEYLSIASYAFEPLSYYMNSDATLGGESVGISINQFEPNLFTDIDGYDEYISFPFTRSTQMIFTNRDLLATHSSELDASGITISDSGHISSEYILHLEDLENISSVFPDKTTLVLEIPYLSMATWFGQSDITWIDQDGEYIINQNSILELSSSLRNLANAGIIELSSAFDASYSSVAFTGQDTVLAVSDAASYLYMTYDAAFKIDIIPMVNVGNNGASFYGSDFAINTNSSDVEKFYSWLFIKFMTDIEENYLTYCLKFGYSPVYLPQIYESKTEYIDFLMTANEYEDSSGNPTWSSEDERWDTLYLSMIQAIYQSSRQEVYPRTIVLVVNSSGVDAKRGAWDDYMEDLFNTPISLETLAETLEDELN